MLASLNLPTLEAITSELCKRSLYAFVVEFWEVLEPGRQFKDNWHIQAICEHLEAVTDRRIKRLIINIPPRHMKPHGFSTLKYQRIRKILVNTM